MNETINSLKQTGIRITSARKKLIDILHNQSEPISVPELMELLNVNKTTIYRELEFLIEQRLVGVRDFGGGKKFYELSSKGHHHHLICTECKKVECYFFEENLSKEENYILKNKNFKVKSHELHFYGQCKNCI